MSDVYDANFGQSFLTLGWEVLGQDPRYWLSKLSSPGKQSANDLVRIPAQLVGAHTAIIAQSGSGKSFFLGRLIEELMLQTSASCLIFDPNGDFTKIMDTAPEELWTEARYDRLRRKGILPHEASREEFSSRWDLIRMRIKTGYQGEPPYKKFQVWWPSVSMAFFAEEVDPILQSELYHCHDFVQAFGDVFELVNDPTRGDFLSQAQTALNLRRDSWQDFETKFNTAKIEEQIDPPNPTMKKEIDLRVKRLIKSAHVAANYVTMPVQRFYFGKAHQYQSSGIVRTSMRLDSLRQRSHRDSRKRLEVVDLPSLGDRNTQMLAIYSNLSMTWKHARRDWTEAMDRSGLEDVRTPTFVIVDEAHNLIPAQTRSKAENAVKEQFKTIIAEGRKYGLFLVLVTQRPDKLDPLILSECENKAIMKLGSESVIEVTRKMLGLEDLAPNLLRKCLEFESGRVLLAGSWCPDGPRICYVAARRTVEGGRSLQTDVWAVPPDVMGLGLAPEAKKAAIELLSNHPHIKFSAGRRSINDNADKMASKLVAAIGVELPGPIPRQLLVMTLGRPNILDIEGELHHQVARELRDWLNAETGDITQTELAVRLANLVTLMLPPDRDKVSGHLTGKAFDIDAPTQNPDAVERTIESLRHLHAFTKAAHGEGVWHLHFRVTEENT
jgi:hypothetical protein